MKEEQIKNYINENKRIWEANELSVEEIAERCLLDGEQLGVDKLNGTARLLQILKDRGIIKSWYYNGSYHIGEVAELEKENEMLEQGYVWDYMTQSKITTKIVTKEKGVTMFEKEAEERAKKLEESQSLGVYDREEDYERDRGRNEGEVVGYEEGFKDGAEFGYNKANEWHYVKDKDYPKDNKPVLCILGDIDSDNCEVGYYNDVGSGEPWHFETYHLPDDDGDNAWGVSAWKEIVLPKESE